MFGRIKDTEVLPVHDIISNAERQPVKYANKYHMEKLVQLNPLNTQYDFELWKCNMRDMGFSWLVNREFPLRLKYAAVVVGTGGIGPEYGKATDYILYKGDLPDFAIDRISLAKDTSPFITIHSQERLNTGFVSTDPIVIAWRNNPWLYQKKNSGVDFHWWCGAPNNSSIQKGFVVAAWDLEKELI